MTNEFAAYDNLPSKQSCWDVSVHNARDLLGEFQQVVNGRYISASSS